MCADPILVAAVNLPCVGWARPVRCSLAIDFGAVTAALLSNVNPSGWAKRLPSGSGAASRLTGRAPRVFRETEAGSFYVRLALPISMVLRLGHLPSAGIPVASTRLLCFVFDLFDCFVWYRASTRWLVFCALQAGFDTLEVNDAAACYVEFMTPRATCRHVFFGRTRSSNTHDIAGSCQ